jgi:aminoglycoside phosphotransferase (APT) family kinase protein
MAGITLTQRDLVATREQLAKWFEHRLGKPTAVSELRAANRAAGWSSESLVFDIDGDPQHEYVVRIPPAGGGMFADYDLEGQTRTQELLRSHGIATPSPTLYESDESWIGTKFMVMPRIVGHTPSDTGYAVKGWMHGAGPAVQRRVHDSFLQTIVDMKRVPVDTAPWLVRAGGTGNGAELQWWNEYLRWGTDNQVPDVMERAFAWLRARQPDEPEPTICWGDARLSNAIFDDTGQIVGALDWEQACLCPAETDLAWWLATRRQTLELHGIHADPELPGFDSRETVISRYQEMIGRELVDLQWYETFSMIRMGCCILRTQSLLRALGQTDHGFMHAPILPPWTVDVIGV